MKQPPRGPEKKRFRFPLAAGTVLGTLLSVSPAWSWGPAGHRIVAMIAQQRLSPAAKAQVASLLFDGRYNMADVSTCADELRSAEHRSIPSKEQYCVQVAGSIPRRSGPWHFIDIPVDISGPGTSRQLDAYCPEGNCVTAKIESFRKILKNSPDRAERRAALLYLIHLVADIHQPLHCAERSCDRGGNLERVDFNLRRPERSGLALHAVWDTRLISKMMREARVKDERQYAARLGARIQPWSAARWSQASVDDMAWESWRLAKQEAYKSIPFENFCGVSVNAGVKVFLPPFRLSGAYEKDNAKIAAEQLMKAGVRLANLLNEALSGTPATEALPRGRTPLEFALQRQHSLL